MATLVRRLGLWSSIGLVIGITIGGGIFRTPAGIAARVPDPVFMLGVWVLGGLIVLCGALAFAELSAAMPETGGMYVYLREGWGRPYAFLYGWAQLVLIRAAALGGISSVFGEYFLRVFGIDSSAHPAWADYLAAGAIVFAAVTNIIGVRLGALFAGISTVTKFGALAFLVLVSFAIGGEAGASAVHFASTGAAVDAGLFGLALISVMWAYDGFADLTFASGEVTDPQRNLPRAIIFGTVAIIAIYLLSNAAYLYVTPIDRLKDSRLIAADTLERHPRTGWSLVHRGRGDGLDLRVPDGQHARLAAHLLRDGRRQAVLPADCRGAPHLEHAICGHPAGGGLGVAMVMTQTFEQLTDTFVLAMWPFYALSVAALYRLRRVAATPAPALQGGGLPVRAGDLHRRRGLPGDQRAHHRSRSGRRSPSRSCSPACRCTTCGSAAKETGTRGARNQELGTRTLRDWQPSTTTVVPLTQLALRR